MKIRKQLRGALKRLGGRVPAEAAGAETKTSTGEKRHTAALPSILNSYGRRADAMPKATPANLRRFAETPVARKAINTIKDRIAGMQWRVQPRRGRSLEGLRSGEERVQVLTDLFEQPNPDDSFRSMAEQVLEDVIVGGFGAIELQATGDAGRPLLLWPVDGATIKMRSDWDGRPDTPRYVQATGRFGADGQIVLNDDELSYIRLNPRTHTPFGLGRLEVAFETIAAFLGAHRYASRLASNSVVQYALWLQNLNPTQHERLIRWWQDEIEGTGKVPILSAESRPEVLRFGGGTDADLRLQWQEFLLRVIADAFDLPPLFLGLQSDVNRSTAGELGDQAFRTAIVPTAKLLAEHLTRDAIAKTLGWHDLEFVFTDVDAQNEREQAEIHEILLRSGVLTVDEVRRMRGLAPFSEKSQAS
ncbi:MAG TPA: phage portal protein [Clostridia bacterium]|nr:phage portal protein [Clostridia bacterium]